jgi:hypothetical protein
MLQHYFPNTFKLLTSYASSLRRLGLFVHVLVTLPKGRFQFYVTIKIIINTARGQPTKRSSAQNMCFQFMPKSLGVIDNGANQDVLLPQRHWPQEFAADECEEVDH